MTGSRGGPVFEVYEGFQYAPHRWVWATYMVLYPDEEWEGFQ